MEPPAIRRGGGGGAEDRISGFPDEILHSILSRVPSPVDAARTSVLSQHWRGVWARMPMPELVFGGDPAPAATPSALLDSIDAAVESPAPPTLRTFKIDVSGVDFPAHRISRWLRFASQRIAGKLHLHVRKNAQIYKKELVLPICVRASEIDLSIMSILVFQPPPTGSFSLLTDLKIACAQMDSADLGHAVSSAQCPRLRKLRVLVVDLVPVRDVSMRSESLQCLEWLSRTGKLEVTAPMLHEISVHAAVQACIVVAPKLEKVFWNNIYDPCRHQFVMPVPHLRLLHVMHSMPSSIRLMERFDTIDKLEVCLKHLKEGIAGYMTLLKEIEKLPTCENLAINLTTNLHASAPIVLHLLRRCSCIRKFSLNLIHYTPSEISSCVASNCPCRLPENCRLDDITFDSLEEIEISSSTCSAEQLEFVKLLLSRCNPVILTWVDYTTPSYSSEIMEVLQRIRSMYHPNSNAQFTMNYREVPKP